jgi:acetyl/propionyl-CoA carboxylase alpha subunit
VQIFGDNHGNVYALGERDCSVQRRHQKIIEESPAVDCEQDPELRKRIHQSAITIGSLLSYQGAGTVEYIFDTKTKEFFFLEVNTRLQVEHPVTEMCSGLDLVSLGIYVGGDGDLSKLAPVANLTPFGHSIECRVCAEEPGAVSLAWIGTQQLTEWILTV